MMEEESKSLSHSLLIFAVVIQSCHTMPDHRKEFHFSPDLLGGDNDDCLMMEDGIILSLVCAVRHCLMLFHHTHILYSPADVFGGRDDTS